MTTSIPIIWTGIGSRSVDHSTYLKMSLFGYNMASNGHILRSGKAQGSDEAFQVGYETFFEEKGTDIQMEIYTPWNNFTNPRLKLSQYDIDGSKCPTWSIAKQLAKQIHPAGNRLKDASLALHARNTFQVLGRYHTDPSNFVIYYADEHNGVVSGGTATAVMIARQNNIPTYNIKLDIGDESIRELWKTLSC